MLPSQIPDTLDTVKSHLNIWAAWMERDDTRSRLGYPSRSVGFSSGGAWGSFIEDNEYQLDKTIAHAVDAILEDMDLRLKHAIFHFHIRAVFKPRRTKIEDDYAEAIDVLEAGLLKRGLL
ncbi:MAG TPA: hypothetical protein VD999_00070 [Vitreimonas sp.]|nr:hypothetical protein [Vitreimonas sp.]